MAYIELGYIFDNREMAEGEKLDIRKVSMYPSIQKTWRSYPYNISKQHSKNTKRATALQV